MKGIKLGRDRTIEELLKDYNDGRTWVSDIMTQQQGAVLLELLFDIRGKLTSSTRQDSRKTK